MLLLVDWIAIVLNEYYSKPSKSASFFCCSKRNIAKNRSTGMSSDPSGSDAPKEAWLEHHLREICHFGVTFRYVNWNLDNRQVMLSLPISRLLAVSLKMLLSIDSRTIFYQILIQLCFACQEKWVAYELWYELWDISMYQFINVYRL